MKKIISLIPLTFIIYALYMIFCGSAEAQVTGTIQKTPATGIVRGNFGVNGIDTLANVYSLPTFTNGQSLQWNTSIKKFQAYTPNPTITASALTKTDDTNVTLTLGGTPSTALLQATSITAGWAGTLSGARGGTGVDNTGKTITLGGNFTTTPSNAVTLTTTGATNVTLPTTGTLLTTAGAASTYLPLAGGALTGTVTNTGGFQSNTSFSVQKNSGASAIGGFIQQTAAGVQRWGWNYLTTETGSGNAGYNFNLNHYDDSGVLIGTALSAIRSNGNIIINNPSTSDDGTNKLQVNGSVKAMSYNTVGKATFATTGTLTDYFSAGSTSQVASGLANIIGSASTYNLLNIKDVADQNNGAFAQFINGSNAVVGSILRVGTTNAVAFNTTSDRRLKTNIKDAKSVLPLISKIKVREFDWKTGNRHEPYGFIAQELNTVVPNAVTIPRKAEDSWMVDKSSMVPMLVKAIQEQQDQIKVLKEVTERQDARILYLEKQLIK